MAKINISEVAVKKLILKTGDHIYQIVALASYESSPDRLFPVVLNPAEAYRVY